jgi:hypothetical protein
MDESEKLLLKSLIDGVKRVENVENSVIEACSKLEGEVSNIKEKVDKHDDFISGNGKEGAVSRLVLVEQTLKVVKRIGYGILTVSIATCGTIVGKLIYDHLTETKEIIEKVAGG